MDRTSDRHRSREIAAVLDTEAEADVTADRSIAEHTSYGIGGPGKLWAIPKSEDAVGRLLQKINGAELPFFVLGGGTNVLVSDRGWDGVILLIADNLSGWNFDSHRVTVHAGTLLMDLVQASVDRSMAGLESMAGIPGTVGGALRMNAGAFGQEIGAVAASVSGYHFNGDPFTAAGTDIHFGYRSAPELEQVVITSTTLHLKPGEASSLKQKVEDILSRRAASQPLEYPSCGSVFKRPPGDYAGRLIEAAGLKGTRIGGAEVSTKHAGFIVNIDKASACDVYRLIKHIRTTVKQRFDVQLETEVKLIGDFLTDCGEKS